jgi:tetratricopeptide (TPR) repeat protein
MNERNSVLVTLSVTVALFLSGPAVYAETAEEYYARTGKAIVVGPGGGFVQAYVPWQDKEKREELSSAATRGRFEVSPQAVEYNRQGLASFKGASYYQSIQYFDRAIEIQPKYPEAIHNRGLAYAALGNHLKAIEDCTQALELDPNNSVVYYDRAVNYSALKKYPQVITDCTQAIKVGFYYGAAYKLRGSAYHNLHEYSKALADFLEANARGEKISQDLIKEIKDKVKAKQASVKAKSVTKESEGKDGKSK